MAFELGNTYSVGNKGGGRKTSYKPEYAKQAEKLCLMGATDADLARFFECGENTLNVWKRKYPEFKVALKNGKDVADAQIVAALFHRARGYKHKATKVMQYKGNPVVVDVIERFPPDTTAAIFWLKNRQPGKWRDTQPQDGDDAPIPDSVNVNVVDASVPDEEDEEE